MSEKYGIPAATLSAYAHGRPIKNNGHRAKFGLPALALVPVKLKHEHKPPLTPKEQRAKAVASLQRAISKAARLELDPWWNTELADMQSCLERIK